MKIMVNLEGIDNYNDFDINENLSVLDLKANISTVFDFSWNEMELLLNDQPLANQLILKDIKINDNVIILRKVKSYLAFSISIFSSSSSCYSFIFLISPSDKNLAVTPISGKINPFTFKSIVHLWALILSNPKIKPIELLFSRTVFLP